MVDGACKMVAEDVEGKSLALAQTLREEFQVQLAGLGTKIAPEDSQLAARMPHGLADLEQLAGELRNQCYDMMQENLTEVAKSQAMREEQLRGELERIEEDTRGTAERSEALARETQRQCRTWVDGALRKLEDLALRTKDRIAALAASSEQREERLATRLESVLQHSALPSPVVQVFSPEPVLAETSPQARSARLAAAAERREARLSATLRRAQKKQ